MFWIEFSTDKKNRHRRGGGYILCYAHPPVTWSHKPLFPSTVIMSSTWLRFFLVSAYFLSPAIVSHCLNQTGGVLYFSHSTQRCARTAVSHSCVSKDQTHGSKWTATFSVLASEDECRTLAVSLCRRWSLPLETKLELFFDPPPPITNDCDLLRVTPSTYL